MGLRERLVASVTDIRNRGQRLVQLNLELLASELKEKGRRFGAAIGLFAGAGVLAFYTVGFAAATVTVALALVLPLWLALLLVTVLLVLLIAILVAVGRSQMRRATQTSGDRAAAEAKKSAELLQANLRQTADGLRARAAGGRGNGRAAVEAAPSPPPGPAPAQPGAGGRPSQSPSDSGATDS